jgi:hypothetical protein
MCDFFSLQKKDDINIIKNGIRPHLKKNVVLTNSAGNLTNSTTQNILEQFKKSTFIGRDIT